jgi:hypothetical protein
MTTFKRCPQSLSILALYCLILLFLVMRPCLAPCVEAPRIAGQAQMTSGGQQVLSVMNYQTGKTWTWSVQDDDEEKGSLRLRSSRLGQ